ncbi:MAG: iron ABC transporter permease, partial [Candidatus Cloacimonetes bacterium]|nr:iron ABC transporter permease [Candidatus Cloacimonadota bacterium]
YELGVSSGATLGVALWILVVQNTGFAGLIFSALFGGICSLILVLMFSTRVKGASLLIVGLMLGYIAGGLVGVLVYFSEDNALRSFLIWSFGTFSATGREHLLWILAVVILCLLPLPVMAKPMNLMLLGEDMALSMGVRVRRIRIVMIVLSSALASVCTAFCGPIAFLGLAVPHAARAIFATEDHRYLIPASALLGACMALVADVFSQLPQSGQILPLNSMMAVMGAPAVIYLLLKGQNEATA